MDDIALYAADGMVGGQPIPCQAAKAEGKEKKAQVKEVKKRLKRCGSCEACNNEDCGACHYCADKVKFGGSGLKKQACVRRRCTAMYMGA